MIRCRMGFQWNAEKKLKFNGRRDKTDEFWRKSKRNQRSNYRRSQVFETWALPCRTAYLRNLLAVLLFQEALQYVNHDRTYVFILQPAPSVILKEGNCQILFLRLQWWRELCAALTKRIDREFWICIFKSWSMSTFSFYLNRKKIHRWKSCAWFKRQHRQRILNRIYKLLEGIAISTDTKCTAKMNSLPALKNSSALCEKSLT